jgi:hypothetical protein
LLLALGLIVASAGCQEARIEHYQAPHVQEAERERPRARMLAVILPQTKEATWFFKLVGRDPDVQAHRNEYDEFLKSVRFPGDPARPIEWKAPAAWERYPGSPVNYASFRVGPKDAPVSFTVTRLGPEARELLPNVNRWRNQLALKPIKSDELKNYVTDMKLPAGQGWLVDIAGATPGEGDDEPPPGLTYQKPDEWKQRSDPRGVRLVVFHVADEGQTAEVGITALADNGGGTLANVNRWRNQIGLAPIGEDQLNEMVRPFEVSGTKGIYVDMAGPEKKPTQRILGVAIERGGKAWFFTMKGPLEIVAKQEPAFTAFLRSVHFEANAQEK